MKKNIVKMVLTTALVATAIIGSNKLEAKAMTVEEMAAAAGCSVAEVEADPTLMALLRVTNEDEGITADVTAEVPVVAVAGVATSNYELLDMVNADRVTAATGAPALVWDADLEVYAQQRVVEVMANFQSPEYANATATNAAKIAHSGRDTSKSSAENITFSYDSSRTSAEANTNWVNSTGHHDIRTKAKYTKYAAASYICPVTGQVVYIELFK